MAVNKPNILLVVLDAAQWGRFSCNGYDRKTTPNIDKIASEGIIFDNAISASPWTLPSVASLFTGVYPSSLGLKDLMDKLPEHYATMAEILSRNGYQTMACHSGMFFDRRWGTDKGFEQVKQRRYFPVMAKAGSLKRAGRKIKAFIDQTMDNWKIGGDNGANWIEKQVKNLLAGQRAPFFLYLHYMETHDPYRAPWSFLSKYQKRFGDIVRGIKVNRGLSSVATLFRQGKADGRDQEVLGDLYDGALNYLDHKIGRIVDILRQKGVLEDTIVIITADHGENLGSHGLMGHFWCLFDSLIKVPLIMRCPKIFAAGERISGQVQNIDILPTLLDILGIRKEEIEQLQGISFYAGGRIVPRRKYAFAQWSGCGMAEWKSRFPEFDFSPYERSLLAVRSDRYKLIWSSDDRTELYDLSMDPGELKNICGAFPGRADSLKKELIHWQRSLTGSVSGRERADLDENVKQRLMALGYLG